jgi:hypothetical protein
VTAATSSSKTVVVALTFSSSPPDDEVDIDVIEVRESRLVETESEDSSSE